MPDIHKLYEHYLACTAVSTDTRNIVPGSLFFALKGDNFNANAFAAQALEKGASYVVVDEAEYQLNERCLLVPDVLEALQELSKYHRSQLSIPVIGLTGSNGKTTTKELIKAVLAEKYKVFATKGNLNNHIGVPLSLLSITKDIEIAVIEMGANHQKEIELLSSLSQPTHGLITNVGMAHLEGFGGFEGVKKGKAELYAFLKNNGGEVFMNHNNADLMEMAAVHGLEKLVFYGTDRNNRIAGHLLRADPFLAFNWMHAGATHTAQANLTGSYNFENCLAAICIGNYFGLNAVEINRGLENYHPSNNRSQLTKTADNTLICDFYNANPSSMTAALQNLSILTGAHKVAILGDMFELGETSAVQHELIIHKAVEAKVSMVIFIGKNFYAFKEQYKDFLFFETPADADAYLSTHPLKEQLILLKGSRGMALEKLMPRL